MKWVIPVVVASVLPSVAFGQVRVLQVPIHPVHGQMEPVAISGDGNVVVGFGRRPNAVSMVWRIDTNTITLLPSGTPARTIHKAVGCSYDGSVVAGTCQSASGQRAFHWTLGGPVTVLNGDATHSAVYSASAMSDDGLFVAGDTPGNGDQRGALWSESSGTRLIASPLSGRRSRFVTDVSADGQAAVGYLIDGGEPFMWRSDSGSFMVPTPQGMGYASQLRLTSMGDAVFGMALSFDPITSVAFTWNATTGTSTLPGMPGYNTTIFAVNEDGRLAVGFSSALPPATGEVAAIHTFGVGTIPLGEYLRLQGATNPDTDFGRADGISNNGMAILGEGGIYPYWVVIMPPPQIADFNADTVIDFVDLADYLDCFEGTGPLPISSADLNRDGFTDFFDLLEFLDNF